MRRPRELRGPEESVRGPRGAGPEGGCLARRKKPAFELGRELKALARERVGPIPAARTIPPKTRRAKPKHKKSPAEEEE